MPLMIVLTISVKAAMTAGDSSSYTSFQFSCRNTFIWLPATNVFCCNWRAADCDDIQVAVVTGWQRVVLQRVGYTGLTYPNCRNISIYAIWLFFETLKEKWPGIAESVQWHCSWLRDLGCPSSVGAGDFLFLAMFRRALGPTQLSYSVGTVSSFPGAEGAEGRRRETHYWASSTADVKKRMEPYVALISTPSWTHTSSKAWKS